MSAPRRADDGSFRNALVCGEPETEFPFTHEGDASAFVTTFTMRQDQSQFRPLAPMSRIATQFGTGYLVSGENTKGIGQGLVEWTRVVASVPRTRTVPGGTVMLNIQNLVITVQDGLNQYDLEEFSVPRSALVKWEYSLQPFQPIQAPRAFVFKTGSGGTEIQHYATVGKWGAFGAANYVLAKDTEQELYRGLIYSRKSTTCLFGYDFTPA